MKEFLKYLAIESGQIIMDGYGHIGRIDQKKNAGLVTDVDRKSEEFIINSIKSRYPESSFYAEESGEEINYGELKWIIDPLDGTSNFAHGFPWFCVSIGVEVKGVLEYGIIYQPVLKELYYAQRGSGAFLNDNKICVSDTRELSSGLLATGFSYLRDEDLVREIKRFHQVQAVAHGVRRAGSAALDFAQVAAGRFSGFWEFGLNAWDVSAGFLLITEAGGKITGYDGGDVTIYEKNFVASNGIIHDELVQAIRV